MKRWRKVARSMSSLLLAVIMIVGIITDDVTVYASEQENFIDEDTEESGIENFEKGDNDRTDNPDIAGMEENVTDEDEVKDKEIEIDTDDINKTDGESGDEDLIDESDENIDEEDVLDENGEEDSLEESTDGENNGEIEDDEESVASDVELSKKKGQKISELEVQEMKKELDAWAERTGRVPSGYIDVDFEAEVLSEPIQTSDESFSTARADISVPLKYDARNTGLISKIRDQGRWGTCWAFSIIASAESAYKRLFGTELEPDLSETHLVNFHYHGNNDINLDGPDGGLSGDRTTALDSSPVKRGGNSLFATFTMASWAGIADENGSDGLLRYPSVSETRREELHIPANLAYEDVLHLENAYWINISDSDYVKEAIMEYGTVGIFFYYEEDYDSDTYKEFFDPSYNDSAVYYNPNIKDTNHAVAIVGWDDTFNKENFKYTYSNAYAEAFGETVKLPKKNGAWLVRNSWGEDVSDDGYFWMSYEEVSLLANKNCFAFDFGPEDNYDHIYQYDGSSGRKIHSASQKVTAAAVYTANGEPGSFQEISAVGVGFASAGTEYTVDIYKDLTNVENPESGVLVSTTSGKTSFQGFYTIQLDDAVIMEAGETFAVVVTARKKGQVALFVDESYTNGQWIRFDVSTENDRTFYKNDKTWHNAGKKKKRTFRIKAYTRDIEAPVIRETDRVLSEAMLEEIAVQEYTGEPVEPEPVLIFSGVRLNKGIDYTVAYEDNVEVSMDGRKASMLVTGIGEYAGSSFKAEFVIGPKVINTEMISIDEVIFDGTVHHKIVTVTHNGRTMLENEDYTVKYSQTPQNAGDYCVTVTGKRNYSGVVEKNFTIDKLDLKNQDLVLIELNEMEEFTGREIRPEVRVFYHDSNIPSANYNVRYEDNKNAGTAVVTITGKNNCMQSITKKFTILPKAVSAADMKVTVKEGTYSGKEVIPAVIVKDGKQTLKQDRDYTIIYEDNVSASTKAKVIIKGLGNYTGEKIQTFNINPKVIPSSKITVTLNAPYKEDSLGCSVSVGGYNLDADQYDLTIKRAGHEETVDESILVLGDKYDVAVNLKKNYVGSAMIKNITCTKAMDMLKISLGTGGQDYFEYTGKTLKPIVTVEDEMEVLKQGIDYRISYSDNINSGTAFAIVAGKGKYGGIIRIPFTINPKVVTAEELKVNIPAQTYTGKEVKPAVTVKYGKRKLKEGADYHLGSFSNNIDVNYNEMQEVAALAEIEIVLSNYVIKNNEETTDILSGNFLIRPAKITSVKAEQCYYSGGKTEPGIMVKAGNLVVPSYCYEVNFTDNEKVGKKAKAIVTANGNGNYVGSKTVTFKIIKEPLSKMSVEGLPDQTYTGRKITIPETDIRIKNCNGEEISPDEYIVKYSNNTKVGTAKVTIIAKADSIYSGRQTIKFKINKADLNDLIGDVKLGDKTYTGKKITYGLDEINTALKIATEANPTYKVSYSNNINAGTATMMLIGKGNYTGIKKIDFMILPCNIKKASVRLKSSKLRYDYGNPVCAEIDQVVFGKFALQQGRDYTVSYVNCRGLGTAYIRITGRGNYSDMKSVYYFIIE